ncbi:uncharacterized protein LOC135470261 isoform X2 [Liolophura sinensis]|uniref:uncharacterized protein LOC135470261 isoform X2 n=1 Tax=Liolophura sinensis TaxID=3198878 RepID=UPI00315814F2
MTMPRKKIPFSDLNELHQAANHALRVAILNERFKRWSKVVETYKRLLSIIGRDHLPDDYEPPASYRLLMYEVHYHLGMALQHRKEHKKAVTEFTKAISAISIPKNGCTAGCSMNTCLLTPVHARRAFALALTGDLSGALKDAERAVVLDSENPDVLCVRALTRSTRDEEPLAIRDANEALRINPDHLAALVVRGGLSRPLYAAWSELYQPLDNEFHKKAAGLNPDTKPFLNVVNFKDPLVLDFYNRFLHNLSVPHTVMTVDLTPDRPSKKQLERNQALYRSPSSKRRVKSAEERLNIGDAFKCGTPTPAEINKTSALRRHDYGEAVRKHSVRPKTAQEYLAELYQSIQQRDATTHVCSGRSLMGAASAPASRPASFLSPSKSRSEQGRGNSSRNTSCKTPLASRETKTRRTKTFTIESPSNYTIPVFQPINIKDAPRMYYRPWKGDRLPTAEISRRKTTLAFY